MSKEKPNANEKDLAKKTLTFLKRAAKEADELNLYMRANDRGREYIIQCAQARGAIATAVEELSELLGLPTEVPNYVAAAEG